VGKGADQVADSLVQNGTQKRSLTIAGHRTSSSLEPAFWDGLKAAATARNQSVAALVAEIDEARTTALSSAIRVWLYERAQTGLP
jgi:predicted DNA-binding ribbon-helix-helix protein